MEARSSLQLQVYIDREVEEWFREVSEVADQVPPGIPGVAAQSPPQWIRLSPPVLRPPPQPTPAPTPPKAAPTPSPRPPPTPMLAPPPPPKPASTPPPSQMPAPPSPPPMPVPPPPPSSPPIAAPPSQMPAPRPMPPAPSWSPGREDLSYEDGTCAMSGSSQVSQERPALCRICKVPPPERSSLETTHKNYFCPFGFSIGPLHHKGSGGMRESVKAVHFNRLVRRSGHHSNVYFKAVEARLEDIINCYPESAGYATEDLVRMIATDGCFIIEMFRNVKQRESSSSESTRLRSARNLLPYLFRYFMLLENQIPFFVLQDLLEMSMTKTEEDPKLTLHDLALDFFQYALPKPLRFNKLKDYNPNKVKHLLHLLQLSITKSLPKKQDLNLEELKDGYPPWIPSATKLGLGGVNITQGPDDFMSIQPDYRRLRLKIPALILDDIVCSFLCNCVAFENCDLKSNKHFSAYVNFMKCLIRKEADAELLSSQRVVRNYSGTEADTLKFFKALAEESVVDLRRSYLADVVYRVNKHYENKWLQKWAGFCHTYFSSPWSFLSAAAAFVVLFLTAIQAHYALFPKH